MNKNSRFPRAKKRFGQNFLHDPGMLQKIHRQLETTRASAWLEIGCGTGVLTSFLSSLAVPFMGIEIDEGLYSHLEKYFKRDHATLHRGSFLSLEESEILLKLPEAYGIVGNIPYHLTSEILRKTLFEFRSWNTLYLMVQKEVGDRILAQPGSSSYGRLSVFCQLLSSPSKVLSVPAGCFQPPPKVASVFLKLEHNSHKLQSPFGDFLFSLIKTGFSQRRKKLRGLLAVEFPRDKVSNAITEAGFSEECRAEEIPPRGWIVLAERLWEE